MEGSDARPRVVLATSNPGKLAELQDAFPEWHLLGLREFPGFVMPEETGETFEDNARLKAVAAARFAKLPALADDSGLCVEALGGEPGVRSARFAGEAAVEAAGRDAANRAELLRRLDAVAASSRRAKFVCVLALARSDGSVGVVRGECAGTLLAAERGDGGFGYDPLFVPDGETRTFAEMSVEEKESLSHRGRAIARARQEFAPGAA